MSKTTEKASAVDMKGNILKNREKVVLTIQDNDIYGTITSISTLGDNTICVEVGNEMFVTVNARNTVWMPE